MKLNINKLATEGWDWLLRKKSFEVRLLGGVFTLLSASLIYRFSPLWNISLTIESTWLKEISYGAETMNDFLFYLLLTVSFIGIFISIGMACYKMVKEGPEKGSMNLVLTQFGLRPELEDKLVESIKKEHEGQVMVFKADVKNHLDNGQPKKALKVISTSILNIKNSFTSHNNDANIYYGGLIATPFAFYTGMEVDDQSKVHLYDYCRSSECWKMIKDYVFTPNHKILKHYVKPIGNDALIIVNTSYFVDLAGIEKFFPGVSVSQITIESPNKDSHWELSFQIELKNQFFSLAQQLSADGVDTIHIILATQNSVAFNLGRIYDSRNLANAIVYQYDKNHSVNDYPWGIKLATNGIEEAEIVPNKFIKPI